MTQEERKKGEGKGEKRMRERSWMTRVDRGRDRKIDVDGSDTEFTFQRQLLRVPAEYK